MYNQVLSKEENVSSSCSCSCSCNCSCLSICLSARLKTKLCCETISKMQQFCEPSSIFELDNVKNEAILRDFLNLYMNFTMKNEAILQDFLQKWKVECRADGLVPMRFAIFSFYLSKVLRLPRKSEPGHTKCCTCHAKKLLTFDKVHNPLRLSREMTSERPKAARTRGAFHILTWKFASRHNGVHFFDSSIPKIAPKLRCFVHFHFEMCFAPRPRALFRHLNFQKCSEDGAFCKF